ncbi:AfsA-related hotdog domain-containing protein [Streptacidiphilus monticola]|uniref:AfsA-related hotdog domain-containing protein n=1 Tax=Streptacidiphilus monticola TaxID=2161674 RepID=A0ABW1FXP8_9ACTN
MQTRPAPAPGFGYHLVHRPDTLEGLMNGSTAAVPQQFGLSLELPESHPLWTDGAGRHHELHAPLEALRRSALFVAHRYFRVPAVRPAVFSTTGIEAVPADAWARPRPSRAAHLDLDLELEPVDVVGGVPRGLECRAALHLDGEPAGNASARIVFLMPRVYESHRARGRTLSRTGAAPDDRDPAADERVRPAEVGRADPANVLIGRCEEEDDGTLHARVGVPHGHPVYTEGAPDHVPSVVLLEAGRQTALLHAARTRGFVPADSVLVGWYADFQGFAEPDLPLYCTAGSGPAERDRDGRALLRVTLRFTQGGRKVAEIEARVLQVC